MGRSCVRYWEDRSAYKFVVGNPTWERETTLVITRHTYEDNIEMDANKLRYEDVDWINLVQYTVSCEGSNNLRLHRGRTMSSSAQWSASGMMRMLFVVASFNTLLWLSPAGTKEIFEQPDQFHDKVRI